MLCLVIDFVLLSHDDWTKLEGFSHLVLGPLRHPPKYRKTKFGEVNNIQ